MALLNPPPVTAIDPTHAVSGDALEHQQLASA